MMGRRQLVSRGGEAGPASLYSHTVIFVQNLEATVTTGFQQLYNKHHLRARVREFRIPPIHEGLVLGRQAPIGSTAISKALKLLMAYPFVHIQIEDDVVGDILVREAILRRLPKERLIEFVLNRIKPLMGPDEIIHLDLETELYLEDHHG
jgi:hypothetical protein